MSKKCGKNNARNDNTITALITFPLHLINKKEGGNSAIDNTNIVTRKNTMCMQNNIIIITL